MLKQALFNNPDGTVSGSKFWYSVAAFVVLVKFALSGVTIDENGLHFGDYNAEGAALILAVFVCGYVGRSHIKSKTTRGSYEQETRKT